MRCNPPIWIESCRPRPAVGLQQAHLQLGEPQTRPAEVFSLIHATPEMLHEEAHALLATNAVVAA
jgi:hypothetical protein